MDIICDYIEKENVHIVECSCDAVNGFIKIIYKNANSDLILSLTNWDGALIAEKIIATNVDDIS